MKSSLLVIDVQRDFCEGGALPARSTPSLIGPLNLAILSAIRHGVVCAFTRDWHPADHCSFAAQGGPWPVHCVQGSPGAEFAEGLIVPTSALVVDIEKDADRANMSYSAFENTELARVLKGLTVLEIAATGIATEYCVRATVLDALRLGFEVAVLTDLIRPIDVQAGNADRAVEEMRIAGAVVLTSEEWLRGLGHD